MAALESQAIRGLNQKCTGYVQQLASFENRVYEVELESDEGVRTRAVAKFYRPGRWNEDQIREEHQFMRDLIEAEIPVVSPWNLELEGRTLGLSPEGLWFCVYPKAGGRQPEDLPPEKLEQLGRLMARVHTVAVQRKAEHRVSLTPEVYGEASLAFLKGYWSEQGSIEPQLQGRLEAVILKIIEESRVRFEGIPIHRLHGDCHAGNILWNDATGPRLIDFDDMVNGPAIQDLWLLAPDPEALGHLIRGYRQFRDLPMGSEALVESLRALRMIHYSTWIAKRYEDPAFQRAFPQFSSRRYWDDWATDLEQQWTRMMQASVGPDLALSDNKPFEGFYDDED